MAYLINLDQIMVWKTWNDFQVRYVVALVDTTRIETILLGEITYR